MLPVFIEDGDDHEASIEASNFKPVWDVLKALRSHDDDMASTLDQYRTNMAKNASQNRESISDKIIFDVPVSVDAEFSFALRTVLVEASTASWEFWFGTLQKYVDEFGTSLVPDKYIYNGLKIGTWVQNQRSRKDRLPIERIERLEALADWSWDPLNDIWYKNYNVLRSFISEFNWQILCQNTTFEGLKIGQWASTQRSNQEKLSSERRKLLEELPGWSWNTLLSNWEYFYNLVQEYINEKQKIPGAEVIYQEARIGQWIGVQRRGKNKLSLLRTQALEALPGWSWDPRDTAWNNQLHDLKNFVLQHKRLPSDKETLGDWISRQRRGYKDHKLSSSRVSSLEAVPYWSWDPRLDESNEFFRIGFEYLLRFYEKNQHCIVKSDFEIEDFKLGAWVNQVRQRKSRLTDKQISLLEGMNGWVWNSLDYKWQMGLERLKFFVARESHACPPQKHLEDGFGLGVWVSRQRAVYKKGKMSAERIQKLESVPGWLWVQSAGG